MIPNNNEEKLILNDDSLDNIPLDDNGDLSFEVQPIAASPESVSIAAKMATAANVASNDFHISLGTFSSIEANAATDGAANPGNSASVASGVASSASPESS